MYNRQDIVGHLGNNAAIRDIAENRKVIALRIASTSHYLSNGKPAEHTEWFSCEVFCSDKQADYFERYARKGALVHASGETRTQKWTDADGNEHSKTVVLVDVGDLSNHLLHMKPRNRQRINPNRKGCGHIHRCQPLMCGVPMRGWT